MLKVNLGEGQPLCRFTFNHKVEKVKIGTKTIMVKVRNPEGGEEIQDKERIIIYASRPVTRCFLDIGNWSVEGKASLFHKDKFLKDKGRKEALRDALAQLELPREHREKIWEAYFTRGKAPQGRVAPLPREENV